MTCDVLLSGFEPFDGHRTNPSQEIARRAAEDLSGQGLETTHRVLPVEYEHAGDQLIEAVLDLRPHLVVALGLAAGRSGITPERVAINLRDARIPDAAGLAPVDAPVVPGGPVGLWSTLPVKAMAQASQRVGVPAAVSQTAGAYVCNDVFYRLQHRLATDPALAGSRGGFVHVPAEDAVPVADAVRAVVAMIGAARESTTDLAQHAGEVS